VNPQDTWDLSSLYPDDGAWGADLARLEALAAKIEAFRGRLGGSAEALADFLDFTSEAGQLAERLGVYAGLRACEDEGDSAARAMAGRFDMVQAKVKTAGAFAEPEILAISPQKMAAFLEHSRLAVYRVYLARILRQRPHILSDREERLLAMHSEGEGAGANAFTVLTNVDMDFGNIDTPEGKRPLSQSTWSVFMENPDRDLRKRAYDAFYAVFSGHKHTLAALYASSVKEDVIGARIRGFPSAREAALFQDDVSTAVYDSLIGAIHDSLPALHRYYSLRKKALRLDALRHYDVYAPLVPKASRNTTWEEAVELVYAALAPLGEEYAGTLRAGLLGRWADRYENRGKRSGAFSSGAYTGAPYILMNYKEDSIRDVFTLAHEGGHSMHSWYAARNNPFVNYSYTIFEAEVASTFNEELLFRHLEKTTADPALRLYLVNKRVDDILATLFRQTMFAEYEKITHSLEESGVPLTVDLLREEYRKLLVLYFGPEMELEEASDLEGLRIPHFYRAFYVYKYATGISAALALARRVLEGGEAEREDYFAFLKSGGSRFPIESLRLAGVDMASPAPVQAACDTFARLVDELEELICNSGLLAQGN
jgi:oligoendopeptidase F